ncbi:hypothetical protein [Luteitalea sp. TBR-22]|uniref:hypothetical protein n=1 Tax=Luteitalea sp. TBR-22 TaxID=2802971 RepID=UPI001EF5726C|nr:hypothetical protein [Luteitalea sp. TBR-22]
MRRRHAGLALVVAMGAMGVTAGTARGTTISFSGGFLGYTGPTWSHTYPGNPPFEVSTRFQREGDTTPRSLEAWVPLPGNPGDLFTSAGIGMGALDLTSSGAAAATVEFWQSFGGSKDAVNRVNFTPAATQVVTGPGQEFLLGTFTFVNGGWFGVLPYTDSNGNPQTYIYPESAFSFRVTGLLSDSATPHTFAGTLRLNVTGPDWPNPTPAEDADYFYFAERPDLGYVGALESYNPPGGPYAGHIELYGRLGSLIPTRFANADGVVLASELPTGPTPVPEPHALALLGAALCVLGARARSSRSRSTTGN